MDANTAEPFHLTRNYSLASLTLIVIVSIALSYAYHRNAEFELIRQGEDKNHVQVQLLFNALDAQTKAQIFGLVGLTGAPMKDDPGVQTLHQTLSKLVAGSSLRKIKIYSGRGITVFSSEPAQIGEDKRQNPGYQMAMVGGRSSDLTHRGVFSSFDGDKHDVDVLGSYLPVRDEFQRIVGVIEVYDDVSPLVKAISATRYGVFALIAMIMLLLYGALMFIVARADRIIGEHAREMRAEAERREQALALAERDRSLALLASRDADVQRKEAEAARAEADRASRAKSEFLASMSHEIRTPMNGIIGFSDLISVDNLPEEERDYVSLIKGSAVGLLGIINDILDLSKVEAGKLELHSELFSPKRVVTQLLRTLQPRASAKGLALREQFADDLPTHARGDPLRLRQVLLNLLGNAIKFTDSGYISVSVRLLALDRHATLEFTVSDTGNGIAADDLARIFQPFEQAGSPSSHKVPGTGLGLTISTRLVQLMNGELSVESRLGKGSDFKFTAVFDAVNVGEIRQGIDPEIDTHATDRSAGASSAPLAPRGLPAVADGASPLAAKPVSRPLVLLVEDNPVNQLVATAMLTRIGVDFIVANNGREGVQMARQEGIALVLMDLEMPDINGLDATRQIRANEAEMGKTAMPIVALTANAMEGDKQACIDAGMVAFMSKPYQLNELQQMLRRYLPPGSL